MTHRFYRHGSTVTPGIFKRSLYQRQRSVLITGAYQQIRNGILELEPEALRRYCWDHFTAPKVSEYDAGMSGGCNGKAALLWGTAEKLVEGVVVHVLENFNPEQYHEYIRERGRKGARKRWDAPGARVTLDDFDKVAGMTIPQQAAALGCSPATVSRLRRAAKARPRVLTFAEMIEMVERAS